MNEWDAVSTVANNTPSSEWDTVSTAGDEWSEVVTPPPTPEYSTTQFAQPLEYKVPPAEPWSMVSDVVQTPEPPAFKPTFQPAPPESTLPNRVTPVPTTVIPAALDYPQLVSGTPELPPTTPVGFTVSPQDAVRQPIEKTLPKELVEQKYRDRAFDESAVQAFLENTEAQITYTDQPAALKQARMERHPVASVAGDIAGVVAPVMVGGFGAAKAMSAIPAFVKLAASGAKLKSGATVGKVAFDAISQMTAQATDYSIRNREALTSDDPKIRNQALAGLAANTAAMGVSAVPGAVLSKGWYQPIVGAIVDGVANIGATKAMGQDPFSPEMLPYTLANIVAGGLFRVPDMVKGKPAAKAAAGPEATPWMREPAADGSFVQNQAEPYTGPGPVDVSNLTPDKSFPGYFTNDANTELRKTLPALSKQTGKEVVVATSDMINLTKANEVLGHDGATALVQKLGAILRKHLDQLESSEATTKTTKPAQGDELSSLSYGIPKEQVEKAYADASAEIKDFVQNTEFTGVDGAPVKLSDLGHEKHGGLPTGIGELNYGVAKLSDHADISEAFKAAEKQANEAKLSALHEKAKKAVDLGEDWIYNKKKKKFEPGGAARENIIKEKVASGEWDKNSSYDELHRKADDIIENGGVYEHVRKNNGGNERSGEGADVPEGFSQTRSSAEEPWNANQAPDGSGAPEPTPKSEVDLTPNGVKFRDFEDSDLSQEEVSRINTATSISEISDIDLSKAPDGYAKHVEEHIKSNAEAMGREQDLAKIEAAKLVLGETKDNASQVSQKDDYYKNTGDQQGNLSPEATDAFNSVAGPKYPHDFDAEKSNNGLTDDQTQQVNADIAEMKKKARATIKKTEQPKFTEETGTLPGMEDKRSPAEKETARLNAQRKQAQRENPFEGTPLDPTEMEAAATHQETLFPTGRKAEPIAGEGGFVQVGPGKPPTEPPPANPPHGGEDRSFGKKFKLFVKGQLASHGNSPEVMAKLDVDRVGKISEQESMLEDGLFDLKDAAKNAYSKHGPTEQNWFEMDQVFKGKAGWESIPDAVRKPLRALIKQKNELSRRIRDSGILNEKGMENFDVENWVNRSYRIHNEKSWVKNVPQETIDSAKNFLRKTANDTKRNEHEELVSKTDELLGEKAKLESTLKKPLPQEKFVALNEKLKEVNAAIKAARERKSIGPADKNIEALVKRKYATQIAIFEAEKLVPQKRTLTETEQIELDKIWQEANEIDEKIKISPEFKRDQLTKERDLLDAKINDILSPERPLNLLRRLNSVERAIYREQLIQKMEIEAARLKKQIDEPRTENATGEVERQIADINKKIDEHAKKLEEVEQRPEMTDSQAQAELNALLLAHSSAKDIVPAMGSLGSVVRGILDNRKDMPEVFRAFLGEYQRADVNAAQSISKAVHMLANYEYLKDLRAAGLGKFLFEVPDIVDGTSYDTPIASEGSKTLEPLAGLYTSKEIAAEMKDQFSGKNLETWLRWWMKAIAITKVNKTVLNPSGQVRNWVGNTLIAVANGDLSPGNMVAAFKLVTGDFTKKSSSEQRAALYYLKRLGVIGESVNAGELRATIRDASQTDMDVMLSSGATKLGRQALKTAEKMYAYGDDFWKIAAFYSKKKRYQKADANITDEQIAAMVRAQYPTYSELSKIVRTLRRFPIVGTFPSFTAEIIRTSFNMFKQVSNDINSSNPKMRALGIKQALSMATAVTMPAMIGAFGSFFSQNKPLSKERDALREFAPKFSQNSELFTYNKTKDGQYEYVDFGFTDPYSYWKKIIISLMRGGNWEEKYWRTFGEVVSPFLSEDILTTRLLDVSRNKKKNGGIIYDPNDPMSMTINSAKHLLEGMEPGFLTTPHRMLKGIEKERTAGGQPYDEKKELIALGGVRLSTIDPLKSLEFMARRYNIDKGNISFLAAKENKEKNMTGPDKELKRKIEAAETLGYSKEQIAEALKAGGVSAATAAFAKSDIKKQIEDTLKEKGKNIAMPDRVKMWRELRKDGYKLTFGEFNSRYQAIAISKIGADDLKAFAMARGEDEKAAIADKLVEEFAKGRTLSEKQKNEFKKRIARSSKLYLKLIDIPPKTESE